MAWVQKWQTGQETVASEELIEAFWDMACELKRGRQAVSYSREDVSDMVNAMLNHRSVDLGFIRRVRPGSLSPASIYLVAAPMRSSKVRVLCFLRTLKHN